MNRSVAIGAGVVAVIVLIGLYLSAFTVSMTQQAIVLQFGDPRAVVTEPGLHWKLPVVQNVVYVDKRILNLNAPPEEIIAKDRKRLVVDAFARYRIVDSLRFYQSIGSLQSAEDRLKPNLVSSLRNVLGDHTLEELVRDNRAGLMKKIQAAFNNATQQFGIEVVDVRIRRADLPEQNSQAIYQRMQTEREREAAEIRAQGNEEAQRIRSRADREVTVLIAESERDAQIARGEGDAKRNEIYAAAYSQDPEFFAFYRSMEAYKKSLKGDNTTMIVEPQGEFFRYFGSESGRR
ncbi:MAG: protease modulator HflC [Alphaproteobacteria bacterium HGW-Alphaproteobacteria-12]|nr:MAG: protease modulator HflC [Alphaproteobacteria bacterium HGW-Alphaproteobacteria-12]